ncbi:hypothetical protein EOD39_21073 [Acipenser ruthenus]|uniref:Peptidase A2 domain-containing protein n=1 Tax=Acipenser ruthenus TaxID=7906 RepID=A0A444UTP5_ACIRT|nr:hypothetical protein EOD39_21073 [Acipenser ruthenus]
MLRSHRSLPSCRETPAGRLSEGTANLPCSTLQTSYPRVRREHGTGRSLYIQCQLNRFQLQALVDTRSTISLLRPGTLPTDKGGNLEAWHTTTARIKTVTGQVAPIHGKRVLQIHLGDRLLAHEFWLADIGDLCILGLDLLSKAGAQLDLGTSVLRVGHHCLPMTCCLESTRCWPSNDTALPQTPPVPCSSSSKEPPRPCPLGLKPCLLPALTRNPWSWKER